MINDNYTTQAARLNTIIGDAGQVWAMVSKAKYEYDLTDFPKETFYVWLKETYGIKLHFEPDGALSLSNEIINEEKYLIFLLKFSEQ